ncbi:MAG: hypothetical protein J1E80_04245 [Desulfovibrionaceae bacterium]|nr:hypothetical protein [Desulfovibrionaceae bacterium]
MKILTPRFLCALLLGLLCACQSQIEALPLPLPDLKVGIAPFTQPTQATELLAGFVPEAQGRIPTGAGQELDDTLAEKLKRTGRDYTFLPPGAVQGPLLEDGQGRRSALATWIQHAREADVDVLLVPQVIHWQERVGGEAGVVSPAAVIIDYFLVDARDHGALLQRSHYAVQQQALADNLFTIKAFFQRGGKWVSAAELAEESMDKAIKELGL